MWRLKNAGSFVLRRVQDTPGCVALGAKNRALCGTQGSRPVPGRVEILENSFLGDMVMVAGCLFEYPKPRLHPECCQGRAEYALYVTVHGALKIIAKAVDWACGQPAGVLIMIS